MQESVEKAWKDLRSNNWGKFVNISSELNEEEINILHN